MTTITLAKANRIRNLLSDKVIAGLTSNIMQLLVVNVNGYETDTDINRKFNEVSQKFDELTASLNSAKNAEIVLRKLISSANSKHSIDEMMADIRIAKSNLRFWADLKNLYSQGSFNAIEISKKITYERSLTTTDRYSARSGSNYYTPSLTNLNKELIEQKYSDLDAKVRALEENRNAKNYAIQVSLDDELVKVLETFKLL